MGVKLYKRSIIANNLVAFLILSLLYLHIIISLNEGRSAINYDNLLDFAISNPVILTLLLVLVPYVIFARQISKVLLAIFILYIFSWSFVIFFINFDKVILLFNAIYIMLALYFYVFWYIELDEAIYCPGFSNSDLGQKSTYHVSVTIKFDSEKEINGYLTNWDFSSCFIMPEMNLDVAREPVKITINFENRTFVQEGEIASKYGVGIGVKFNLTEKSNSLHNWSDFYTVICDRGIKPQNLKGWL